MSDFILALGSVAFGLAILAIYACLTVVPWALGLAYMLGWLS